jgi:hypothetical protein
MNNDLSDIHVENADDADFQNFVRGKEQENMFVYANWLKPGLHKFLIYCPVSQRLFVKSMLINTNKKDFYPKLRIEDTFKVIQMMMVRKQIKAS